ncbi:MAG: hypothetical protein EXS09_04945 [Gemmataceae bacterium]|nr:hypothetical protein [Gemmataceae bacterium]
MPARDIVRTLRANNKLLRVGEPVTCGVRFPRGLLRDATTLRMIAPDDSTISVLAGLLLLNLPEVVSYYQDGSRHDFRTAAS